jgi:hypothetical protein
MSIATTTPNARIQLAAATLIAAATGSRSDRCPNLARPHNGGYKQFRWGREVVIAQPRGFRARLRRMTELKWFTIQSGQRAFPM